MLALEAEAPTKRYRNARVIGDALPMTYFLEILRSIIVCGARISDLWVPAVMTVAFGGGVLALASLCFSAKPS